MEKLQLVGVLAVPTLAGAGLLAVIFGRRSKTKEIGLACQIISLALLALAFVSAK